MKTVASKINVVSQLETKLQAQTTLECTTKFTGERKDVGMIWSKPEPNVANNNSSAWGQLYSLEQRFQRDANLKDLFQQSVEIGVGIHKDIGRVRIESHLPERVVFVTPSSTKFEQTGQSKLLQCCIKEQRSMPKR